MIAARQKPQSIFWRHIGSCAVNLCNMTQWLTLLFFLLLTFFIIQILVFLFFWCASLIGFHANRSAQACPCHRQRDASHHVRHRCSHPRKSPLWRLDDQKKSWRIVSIEGIIYRSMSESMIRFSAFLRLISVSWGLYCWGSTPFVACLQKFHGHTDCSIISEHSQSFPSEFGILQSPALLSCGPFLFLRVLFLDRRVWNVCLFSIWLIFFSNILWRHWNEVSEPDPRWFGNARNPSDVKSQVRMIRDQTLEKTHEKQQSTQLQRIFSSTYDYTANSD